MREYYDVQVHQQNMQRDAERERQAQQVRVTNAKPNSVMLKVGEALVAVGEGLQHNAERNAQHKARRLAHR